MNADGKYWVVFWSLFAFMIISLFIIVNVYYSTVDAKEVELAKQGYHKVIKTECTQWKNYNSWEKPQ